MGLHRIAPLVLWAAAILSIGVSPSQTFSAETLPRLKYNHPGLKVDLGVGLWAWPMPMDYDGDGDYDLVVVCPDVPFNGTYLFENPAGPQEKFPTFKPPRRIGKAVRNPQLSWVDGKPRVLSPGNQYPDFQKSGFDKPSPIPATVKPGGRIRADQWRLADLDGDGRLDLVVGQGDWEAYGWDDAFDAKGQWTRGPLHGYVYWLKNVGTNQQPRYAKSKPLLVTGGRVDTYGMPSPNLADFDGDGDVDMICGEFLDGFSYFENLGNNDDEAGPPEFAPPRRLKFDGQPIHMDLQMIVPTAIDWDRDGDVDLVVGDEDGRVALVENTGQNDEGVPRMRPPRYFQQQADEVKFGALVTPVSVDWDRDGDQDLVCGNTAGYVGLIENLDGGNPPRWAAPRRLEAGGSVLRIQAGPKGSIQGPCEAKWGYTTLSVADWDHDGRLDLVVNSIWGKIVWYRNVGTPQRPKLAEAEPVVVQWKDDPQYPSWNWWKPDDGQLATQWRTTPVVVDLDRDQLNDLVMLDHQGYLTWWQRQRVDDRLVLLPPKRAFASSGACGFNSRHQVKRKEPGLLQLNVDRAGRSGRRKLCMTDWDGDGELDLLVNSVSVDWLKNTGRNDRGQWVFEPQPPLTDHRLAGHTTSPTVVDWNRDGKPELLIGAEDGFLYYKK